MTLPLASTQQKMKALFIVEELTDDISTKCYFFDMICSYEQWHDFIRDRKFGMVLSHIKFQILTYFSWRHSSVRSSFFYLMGFSKSFSHKNIEHYVSQWEYSLPWKPILFSFDIAEIWHTNGHIRQQFTVFFGVFLESSSGFDSRLNIRCGTFTC